MTSRTSFNGTLGNMHYPRSTSQLPTVANHRRAASSTIPSSVQQRAVASRSALSPWADPISADLDLIQPEAGGKHWSDAASRFMDTRPGDFSLQQKYGLSRYTMSSKTSKQHDMLSMPSLSMMGATASSMPPAVTPPDPPVQRAIAEFVASRNINPLPRHFDSRPDNARYFVIKSNSAVNIHAAIRYGLWSSTELGNRRLDNAYATGAPIFLFFSVTSSGRFCGVARMASSIDWTRSAGIWEQGKQYKGVFEVRWIFLKDIPNAAVRHLKVSTNENKPVSNSRDTQELSEQIGHDVLRIFTEYQTPVSILADVFASPSSALSMDQE
ncbi:hypothetical protein HKX48_007278 [Thoreauomyces humboldtii]|nr:hypothetical protein HKX48_007278 [Thoreauomyces humboldtii]